MDQERARALFFEGVALFDGGDFAGAEAKLRAALAIVPDRPSALSNLAAVLVKQDKLDEAARLAERAGSLDPQRAEAWITLAAALTKLHRHDEALAAAERAMAAAPADAAALKSRGSAYSEMRDYPRAIVDFAAAYRINPDEPELLSVLVAAKLHCCDWRDLDPLTERLLAGVRSGQASASPFRLLAVPNASEADHLACARATVLREHRPQPSLYRGETYRHERIRVAYVSGDYYRHPTTFLMAGVFEHHDRGRFETFGISYGPDDGSAERRRAAAAFDHFLDVRNLGAAEAAALMHAHEIDVAVDLGAFTSGGRLSIFASRPAPLQVAYLGYPGTTGAPYMDYIIADEIVLPPEARPLYTEKVVSLAGSYQANDDTQIIAASPTRAEAGLPAEGFVFASFNNAYKTTPAMFSVWMGLLAAVPGSVLWLLRSDAAVSDNLRREAAARGIDPARLIMAPPIPRAEHLARQRLADLFLDTLPYNAHTTASDALWAGLPVVTCVGPTFAGRVGASLLTAAGLPELIARSPAEYESLALRLARDPAALAAIKTKLAANRTATTLFDTAGFTARLERAYAMMVERHQAGLAPAAFAVP